MVGDRKPLTHTPALSVEKTLQHDRENLRSALLASVSHDLKTPLVSVIGSLSTLLFVKDSLGKKERYELILGAYQEAERLHRIVHNVLEMMKLETGELITHKEAMDMLDIVRVAAARVKRTYPSFSLRIDNQLDGLVAWGDELLIGQVMYNLLDNAAKYGRYAAEVKIKMVSDEIRSEIQVLVMNQGQVIAEKERAHIFDKFYRSTFTDAKQAGSGLGLAICKAIVEAHGGTIGVEVRDDGVAGMVFQVSLPAVANILHTT